MKTKKDPRHQRRIKQFKDLFKLSFKNQPTDIFIKKESLKKIDQLISKSAPEWPIDKLNKVDLAILRLAVYELVIKAQEPPKVIIDEAIELAKQFGTETTSKFINGALGKLIKIKKIEV